MACPCCMPSVCADWCILTRCSKHLIKLKIKRIYQSFFCQPQVPKQKYRKHGMGHPCYMPPAGILSSSRHCSSTRLPWTVPWAVPWTSTCISPGTRISRPAIHHLQGRIQGPHQDIQVSTSVMPIAILSLHFIPL